MYIKKILFFIFFIIIFISAKAQESEINYISVDTKTYNYYMLQKWDSLIIEGKAALKKNIDYYNLRMRLGIAYFEKKDFNTAATHFLKAYNYSDKTDTISLEDLYFSHLYAGNETQARAITKFFSNTMLKRLNIKNKLSINNIYFENAYTFSNNEKQNASLDIDGLENIYGEQDRSNDGLYEHLGFKIKAGKYLSFYQGVNYIGINKNKQIQFEKQVFTGFDRKNTYKTKILQNKTYHDTTYTSIRQYELADTLLKNKYKLNQIDYYGNCDIQLTNGIKITPAIHLMNVQYSTINYRQYKNTTLQYADTSITKTQYYYDTLNNLYNNITLVNYTNKNIQSTAYEINLLDTVFINFIGSLSVSKGFRKCNIGLFSTFSNINNYSQLQTGLNLLWTPKGNLNLYTNTTLVAVTENQKQGIDFANFSKNTRFVVNQSLGFKVLPKLWTESFFAYGDMRNFNEKNAFVVYNSADAIQMKWGLAIISPLSKNIELSLRYQYANLEASYYYQQSSGTTTITTKYINQTLIGGIKWNF